MSLLTKYLGQIGISETLSEMLETTKQTIQQNKSEYAKLDSKVRSIDAVLQRTVIPKVIRNEASITEMKDRMGGFSERLDLFEEKVGSIEDLSGYIPVIERLDESVKGISGKISFIETDIDHISSGIETLTSRINSVNSKVDKLPNEMASSGVFLTKDNAGSLLSRLGFVTSDQISSITSTLSQRITNIEQTYMTKDQIESYVRSQVPTTETMQKLINFANTLPTEINTIMQWQVEVNNQLQTVFSYLQGNILSATDNGKPLSQILEETATKAADKARVLLSNSMNIPTSVIDLYSWIRDRLVSEDIVAVMGYSTYISDAYATSQSNKAFIDSLKDQLGLFITTNTKIQSKLGDTDFSMSVSEWISTLSALDDNLWSYATYKGKPITEYLHDSSEIHSMSREEVTKWVNDNLNNKVQSIFDNKVRPDYISTITENNMTKFASDMLSQNFISSLGNNVSMLSIVDISEHIMDIRDRLDTLTDITGKDDITVETLRKYVTLKTMIGDVAFSFDTYEDYRNYIIEKYRIPFVDSEGHRYKLVVPQLKKYINVTKHESTQTITSCVPGVIEGEKICTTEDGEPGHYETRTYTVTYWTAEDEAGNTYRWDNNLPPHVYYDNGVMYEVKGFDTYLFYTKPELDDFLAQNQIIDPVIADLYKYTANDPSDMVSVFAVDLDDNYNVTKITLSDTGKAYINNLAEQTINQFMPKPVFTLMPSLSFTPGTSIEDVIDTVKNYISSLVPNTVFDRIVHISTPDIFASIVALPSTIGSLEISISSLRNYVVAQVVSLGRQIDQMIDPHELEQALSQFGTNIQAKIDTYVGDLKSRLDNLSTTVGNHTSLLDTLNEWKAIVDQRFEDITVGVSIDISALWSKLSSYEISSAGCTLGDIIGNLRSKFEDIKIYFKSNGEIGSARIDGLSDFFGDIHDSLGNILDILENVQIPSLQSIKDWIADKIKDVKWSISGWVNSLPKSTDEVKNWVQKSSVFQYLTSLKNNIIDSFREMWNSTLDLIYTESEVTMSSPTGTWTRHIVSIDKSGDWYVLKGGDVTTAEWAKNLKPLIGKTLKLIGFAISSMITTTATKLKEAIAYIIDSVKDMLSRAVNYINTKFSEFAGKVKSALEHIANILSGLLPDGSAIDTDAPVYSVYKITEIKTELSTVNGIIDSIRTRFEQIGDLFTLCPA